MPRPCLCISRSTSTGRPGAWRRGHQGLRDGPPLGRFDFGRLEARIAGNAAVIQLAECQLPKLDVAGSNPVGRSTSPGVTVTNRSPRRTFDDPVLLQPRMRQWRADHGRPLPLEMPMPKPELEF